MGWGVCGQVGGVDSKILSGTAPGDHRSDCRTIIARQRPGRYTTDKRLQFALQPASASSIAAGDDSILERTTNDATNGR